MSVEILEPGLLTSVQDAIGRQSWRHLGVPVGGAADAWSARLANRLVGNPDDAPVLEITLVGPTLRLTSPTLVALVGRIDGTVDGLALQCNVGRSVRPGATIRIGEGEDARAYLAFGGGIAVEPVLGSRSTDLRTGFGGHGGRALRAGDRLDLGEPSATPPQRWTGTAPSGAIRVVAGPHADRLAPGVLEATAWTVSPRSDRTGVRLDGPALPSTRAEVPSMGLPAGAIQLPHDGLPIVALADRPVTGGYPVPAVVIGADVGRVARLRPGDELRFASVSVTEAREALRRAQEALAEIEPMGDSGEDLGWVGSHD